MHRLVYALAAIVWIALGAHAATAQNREEIQSFESDIAVGTDGVLRITETITVRALGQQIRRGIYRDFPTTYRDRHGNTVRTTFVVEKVTRDGRPENFFTESRANGIRLYIGRRDVFLRPGVYRYAITYRSARQIGFFEDDDELYWNVTGNGWAFPIDRASATVQLPPGADILKSAAFTGPQGARGGAFRSTQMGPGRIHFATTEPLRPHEGLTIAVAWPKGFVREPTMLDRLWLFIADNRALMTAGVAAIVVLVYFLGAWWTVGRDPKAGTIIPLFEPPADISPAAARFLTKMGFDDRALSAAILNLAVKGYLQIHDDGGRFALVRAGPFSRKLSPGERAAAETLFTGGGNERVELTENQPTVQSARTRLNDRLKREFGKINFRVNRGFIYPGWGFAVLGGFATFLALKGQINPDSPANVGAMALIAVAGIMCWAFPYLLKAPTLRGRRLLDQIDGFKMFLSVAEQDRFEVLHPPDVTPEVFEKYLPYALALDVENEWNNKFNRYVAASGQSLDDDYQPYWYRGRRWSYRSSSGLTRGLGGAFTSSISAAATVPGSSSGFGGGGFSGGGGGGGGGGGW